ncbi:MAG: hypothetical protein LBN40_01480 [Oscillospiraceae bacterium]|nr:hypothetical protein [Oscillospiraceae bacterium]
MLHTIISLDDVFPQGKSPPAGTNVIPVVTDPKVILQGLKPSGSTT